MHPKSSSSTKAVHDKRLFVLDTNVLMHDPTALFRFQEHDIHLPMMVLEELDRAKKGLSEVARNVRQVSRFLDELIAATGWRRCPPVGWPALLPDPPAHYAGAGGPAGQYSG